MKKLIAISALASLGAFAAFAQDESPFADAVEMRHGLMLQMATDLGTMGDMAKGKATYDAAAASKAAANVAAIASVLSMSQFPEGSENGKAEDSFALPAIWANSDDFIAKIADLNTAAGAMKDAAGSEATLKDGVAKLAAACSACHKDYRQPES